MSSPTVIKTSDLLVWFELELSKFPKAQRFRLALRIEESILRFYDLVLRASHARKQGALLQEADLELERLRMLVRAAQTLQAMNFKQYETASKKINEVGKLLGGWLKSIKEATPAGAPAEPLQG